MSYLSMLSGEMEIVPPLKWSEFKDSKHFDLDKVRKAGLALCLLTDTQTEYTEDGVLERRTAYGVGFAYTDPVKLYDIVPELQALVDAHPGHEFAGEFEGTGTAFGDMWLLRVREDRRVVRILPSITWPDGSVTRNERYENEKYD